MFQNRVNLKIITKFHRAMFYHKEEISELLKCPKCKVAFDTPCMLPCGQHMCKTCIDHLCNAKKDGFDCTLCHEFHARPASGFPISQLIVQLLEKKPGEIYRNKTVDSLKSHLNEIKSTVQSLVQLVNQSEHKIKEHCDFVRHDVQLVTDSAYEYIDKFREQFMSEIDAYEKECLLHLAEMVNAQQFSSDEIKREMDTFIDEQAKQLKSKLDLKLMDMKAKLFKGKQIVFEENKAALESKMIGAVRFNSLRALKSYSFKYMKHLRFRDIYPDLAMLHSAYALDGDQFILFYLSTSGYQTIRKIDINGTNLLMANLSSEQHPTIQTTTSFFTCKEENKIFCFFSYSLNERKIKNNYNNHYYRYNNRPVDYSDDENGVYDYNYYEENQYEYVNTNYKCLRVLDSNLSALASNSSIIYNLIGLACNKDNVFGAENRSIHVFNNGLQFIKTIASTTAINKLEASDERLFVLDTSQQQLSLIKISDSTTERKFAFACDNLIYHLDNFIVSFDKQSNKLIWYDINGVKYETYLGNFPIGFLIADSIQTDLVFVNHTSFTLTYQP